MSTRSQARSSLPLALAPLPGQSLTSSPGTVAVHHQTQVVSSNAPSHPVGRNQLPQEERKVYIDLFLKVDSECGNGDGALTIDEFEKLLIICGHRLPRKDIALAFVQMDTDGNWKITLDEFLAVVPALAPPNSTEYIAAKIRRAFNVYNVRTAGGVTYKEFPALMASAGHPLSEIQIQELHANGQNAGEEQLDLEKALIVYAPK
ncbi:calmodulin-4-like [Haliotis rubra]|uniref:calmodulin-4-like n=1 Tax=Haliotis rubra TaxID=36100 RepID=UPI001EE585DE|nr:calmodulin-4-like [Haliotis rubra]